MSRATFRPAEPPDDDRQVFIQVLVIDEAGEGVEIRIWSDGQVVSSPMTQGVEHYRASPLWEEVVDGT